MICIVVYIEMNRKNLKFVHEMQHSSLPTLVPEVIFNVIASIVSYFAICDRTHLTF